MVMIYELVPTMAYATAPYTKFLQFDVFKLAVFQMDAGKP